MNRYMTQGRKRQELEQLASNENLDDGIRPYLDDINSLYSVCTLQSCTGHIHEDGSRDDGHLWLWLSEDIAEEFEYQVFDDFKLAQNVLITRLGKRYLPTGEEIIDICFRGVADGQLDDSMKLIREFFRWVMVSSMRRG